MSLLQSPEALVKKAGTRDPFEIAKMLEIPVHHVYHPESKLPGLTAMVLNRPSIFINDAYFDHLIQKERHYTEENAMDDTRQVGGHELGHACKHRTELKIAPIKEFEIFNVRTPMEAEANTFAAGILIDKRKMLELLNEEITILQVAAQMHVNVNLLIYRIEMLREEGFFIPTSVCTPASPPYMPLPRADQTD